MDEYIDREVAIQAVEKTLWQYQQSVIELRKVPSANVAHVRHGKWIERKSIHADGGISAKCSACQKDVQYLGNPLKYCPNCGAKMDL